MLAGFEGSSVTVACYYHLPRRTGIKWCKLVGKISEDVEKKVTEKY